MKTFAEILSGTPAAGSRDNLLEKLGFARALNSCHLTSQHSGVMRSITHGRGWFQGRIAQNRIVEDTGLPRERVDAILQEFRAVIQSTGAIH